MSTEVRHVLDARQFDVGFIASLFERARWIDGRLKADRGASTRPLLAGRLMFSLFFEPSTRTRFSFETAASRMGMDRIESENAGEFSSRSKGESDLDMFRALASYRPDVIVTRHDETNALPAIAQQLDDEGFDVPIINAGDGRGQHPTQTLLDLYTIQAEIGRIEHINVAMVGDLANGRTVRSLAYLLSKYPGNRITFVAPDELQIGDDILAHLDEHGIAHAKESDLSRVLPQVDVVYMTRIQAERLQAQPDEDLQMVHDRVAGRYRITPRELALMRPDAIVMHPLPRVKEGAIQRVKTPNGPVTIKLVSELSSLCDADQRRAAYWRQLGYGLPVRMALLEYALAGEARKSQRENQHGFIIPNLMRVGA